MLLILTLSNFYTIDKFAFCYDTCLLKFPYTFVDFMVPTKSIIVFPRHM